MRINNDIRNRKSFNGWVEGSKEILAKKVAQFSVKQRHEIVSLVNDIEKTSVNHIVHIDDYFIAAHPRNWDFSDYKRFWIRQSLLKSIFGIEAINKKNFKKVLINMRDFLIKDNSSAKEIQKSAKEYEKFVKKYTIKKDDYIHLGKGLRLDNRSANELSYILAKEAQKPNGHEAVETLMKRIANLDKRAKEMSILISKDYDTYLVSGGNYTHLHTINEEIKGKTPIFKVVEKIEKIVSSEEKFHVKIQEEAKQLKIKREQEAIKKAKKEKLAAKKALAKEERKEKIKKFFGLPTKKDETNIESQFNF